MPKRARGDRRAPRDRRSHRRKIAPFALAADTLEAAALWLRTSRVGGRVVVRCRHGHLFTTIWIPGVSAKALRLGLWRFQRCPVARDPGPRVIALRGGPPERPRAARRADSLTTPRAYCRGAFDPRHPARAP